MTKETVDRDVETAKRFLVLAQKLQVSDNKHEYYITGSPLSGEVRRASMDLTRRLAEMRRPGWYVARSSNS